MPWEQRFIPVWTGSGLDRISAFGDEQTTITCTIDMRDNSGCVVVKSTNRRLGAKGSYLPL